jgi:hypothetical protein
MAQDLGQAQSPASRSSGMISRSSGTKPVNRQRIIKSAVIGLAALLASGLADPLGAKSRRHSEKGETVTRPAGEPLLAIVSLASQRVTIYDADGLVTRAPVSSGRSGYETPPGIYSILQKEMDHKSNLYDDADMPYMQRLTWSGIALHAGSLPGYPASHGCVRMPRDFAQKLYGMTKIGMRVIIAPNDVQPDDIDHPALFKPKGIGGDSTARPATPKSIAADKAAEARAATKKAYAARLAASRLAAEAARLLPVARGTKIRAEAQLASAERLLAVARSASTLRLAEENRARAAARLAEAEAKLQAAEEETPPKQEAAARAWVEADEAEAARIAALEAASEAKRRAAPLSMFISRKTGRLYVRQAFQEVLDSPVTIRDADETIGTHIFTALDYAHANEDLRWNAVSLDSSSSGWQFTAAAALDRIEVPSEAGEKIAELISPGSALIISDEGPSKETGKDTDFVVLMSGEPQGAIKTHRRQPSQATSRRARHERQVNRSSARRARAEPPPYPNYYGGGPYAPW